MLVYLILFLFMADACKDIIYIFLNKKRDYAVHGLFLYIYIYIYIYYLLFISIKQTSVDHEDKTRFFAKNSFIPPICSLTFLSENSNTLVTRPSKKSLSCDTSITVPA